MADVAAAAGVSRTLVSFVLDGKPGASPATRERVLAAAAELGYRPDSAARLLALGRSRTLGVLTDVRQLFQAELVTGIYPAAERRGYEVLLTANLADRDESVPIDALLSHRCGSLILLGPDAGPDYLRTLAARVPVVVVGRRLPAVEAGVNLATVRTHDAKGIRQAVDYLVELGHRDIHHVDGGTGPGSADRRSAYRAAMRQHGLGGHARVVPGAHTEAAGAAAAATMLAEPSLPSAVLASNDRCALGLLDGFTRAGVDVPGRLSLIGFDDTRLADNPRIDLTTVHQDATDQAEHAVRLAVDMLEQTRTGPEDVVLEPKLVIRGTTAPPAG
ncbi:LacI family transcriptional regulator [Mycobacterium sp. PS03-16]|uniref:LacI family DNA-binding transcriptional regulator n=1 Tax=Mycobacterium sp. PS03-16 TaxID=2559611 RepID=UPI001073C65B|nr:LacI family DNA-binding transcriptional regulator [Mycobacterium sp. PS03-16]TFV55833.1 LacI family transcriptional regulator [Mycobacterium sp. PS03-16]